MIPDKDSIRWMVVENIFIVTATIYAVANVHWAFVFLLLTLNHWKIKRHGGGA